MCVINDAWTPVYVTCSVKLGNNTALLTHTHTHTHTHLTQCFFAFQVAVSIFSFKVLVENLHFAVHLMIEAYSKMIFPHDIT